MIRALVASVLLLASLTLAHAGAAPGDNSRTRALAGYQHDLLSVLVLRADATHLLGAALLARDLDAQPPGQASTRLLQRAAQADPDNPAIAWASLANCDAKAGNCPNAEAMARLRQLAPDNAAVWILALDVAARDGDRRAELDSLHKAAAARVYNDYGGDLLKALTLAATALPVPDQALRDYTGGAPGRTGPASAQAFLAYGRADAIAGPSFFPLMALCDPDAGGAAATNREPCRKLARVLAWGSSPRARAVGLHLKQILADDAEERTSAESDMRDLTWQLRNYSHLVLKALRDQSLAVQLLRLGQSGGSELSRMSALLQHEGIPTRAPSDAEPASPDSSPARTSSVAPAAPAAPAPASSTPAAPAGAPAPSPAAAPDASPAGSTAADAASDVPSAPPHGADSSPQAVRGW